jgi:hypothetical protein
MYSLLIESLKLFADLLRTFIIFSLFNHGFSYNWIRLINNRLFIPWLNKLVVFEEITEWVFVIHKTGLVVEGPIN